MESKAQLTQKIKFLEVEIANAYSNVRHQKCSDLLKSAYYDRIASLDSQVMEAKKKLEKI